MALAYFKFYPGDWLGDPDVENLSLEAEGAFVRLLARMWLAKGSTGRLPDDDAMLAKLCKVRVDVWRNRIRPQLVNVLTFENGEVFNGRQQVELSLLTRGKNGQKSEVSRTYLPSKSEVLGTSSNVSVEKTETYDGQNHSHSQNQKKHASSPDGEPPALKLVPEKIREKPHPDHRALVDAFTELYAEKYKTKPTWGAKQGKQIRDLLKAHGLEKCRRHATRLFCKPPDWLAQGGGAFTLGTLVANFDALADEHAAEADRCQWNASGSHCEALSSTRVRKQTGETKNYCVRHAGEVVRYGGVMLEAS